MGDTLKLMSSGVLVDLYEPTKEQIRFSDISIGLNNLYRYGGTSNVMTVARHTVHGLLILEAKNASDSAIREWLMHDMHEYAIGEITTPMKRAIQRATGLDVVKLIERKFDNLFCEIAGVTPFNQSVVKLIDGWTYAAECKYILGHNLEKMGATDEEADAGWLDVGFKASPGRMTDTEVMQAFNDAVAHYLPALFGWEGRA